MKYGVICKIINGYSPYRHLCITVELSQEHSSFPLQLPPLEILTVPYGTQVITPDHVFEGHSNFNMTLNHTVGSISQLPNISVETPKVTFHLADFDLQTIADLQDRWENEKSAIRSLHVDETQHWFLRLIHYLGYATSFLIVFVTLYLAFKVYRCYRPSSPFRVLQTSMRENPHQPTGVNISLTTTEPVVRHSSAPSPALEDIELPTIQRSFQALGSSSDTLPPAEKRRRTASTDHVVPSIHVEPPSPTLMDNQENPLRPRSPIVKRITDTALRRNKSGRFPFPSPFLDF